MSSPHKKKSGSGTPPAEPEKAAEEVKAEAPVQDDKQIQPYIKIAVMQPIKEPNKVLGRPIEYSEELADKVVDLLHAGLSLSKIGDEEDLPSTRTISRWRMRYPEFNDLCSQAVRQSIWALEDRALGMVSNLDRDIAETELPVERFKLELLQDNRSVVLEVASRRQGDLNKMATPQAGDDAKVIDLPFEVVSTPDDPRFDEVLKNWERTVGLKSSITREEEAAAKAKEEAK